MTFNRLLWRVGRTVLLYGWFVGLSVLMAALLEIGLLPQIRAVLSWGAALVLWIGSAALSFFALYSCLHQFALNDTVHYRAFLESTDIASKPRWRDAARATVKSPAFLCETVVLVAMIMGLPTGAGWAGLGALAETYLPLPRALSRLLIGALVSVIGTALNFSAHISAEANWRLDARAAAMKQGSVGGKRAMAPGWRRLLLYAFFVSLGYAFLCLAGPVVVFAVGGLLYTIAGFLSWQLAAVFVGLFLLLLAHRYLRALRAVRRFKKDVLAVCREAGYTCSGFSHLYGSVLPGKRCGTFSVVAGGKRYACCVAGAVRRGNRMLITGNDCIHECVFRLFKRPLLCYYHNTSLDFPADGERILIVHPAPYTIMVGTDGVVREGVTGDRVGKSILYTAANFLGCLARDCIGKN